MGDSDEVRASVQAEIAAALDRFPTRVIGGQRVVYGPAMYPPVTVSADKLVAAHSAWCSTHDKRHTWMRGDPPPPCVAATLNGEERNG